MLLSDSHLGWARGTGRDIACLSTCVASSDTCLRQHCLLCCGPHITWVVVQTPCDADFLQAMRDHANGTAVEPPVLDPPVIEMPEEPEPEPEEEEEEEETEEEEEEEELSLIHI